MHWTLKTARRLRLFFETMLVLVMLMGAVVAWGLWHLSQGPIDLKPALPLLTRTFNSWIPGITTTIGDASLEWGGHQTPFQLHVWNVDLINPRGRTIGTVAEATLGLAPTALLVGQIAPTTIDIASPSFTITRFPDGHIGLRFDRRDNETDQGENSLSISELVDLLKIEHYAFTTFLQRIMISEVTIRYRDFMTQRNSISEHGRLLIERSPGNILSGEGLLDIPIGDTLKPLTLDIHSASDQALSIMTLRLPSLTAQDLQTLAPQADILTHITGTLDTDLNIGFDAGLQTRFVELAGKLDQASLVYPDMFDTPVQIKTGQFGLHYNLNTKQLSLRDTHFVLPDGMLGFTARTQDPFNPEKPVQLDAQAELQNLSMSKLNLYWPKNLAHSARHWVTNHIQDGTADKAILQIKMSLPAGALPTKSFAQAKLDDLKGSIDFHGLTTDYLPPMIPVKNIDGQALFNRHEFTITPTTGTLRETHVKSGTIKIAPLDKEDVDLDLTLLTDGPVQDALILLSDKPLEFTQQVGIDPQNISGQAETTLHLQFPLRNDLELHQLTVKAASIIKDLTVRKAYQDAVLRSRDIHLAVDGKGLTLSGEATLSDASLQSLSWDEFFGHDATMRRQFAIKGRVTPQLLKDLHLDPGPVFQNSAIVDTKVVEHINRDTTIDLTADLTPSVISIPALHVLKPAGQAGTLKMHVATKSGQNTEISDVDFVTSALTARNVKAILSPDGHVQSFSAPSIIAGKTNLAVTAKSLPRNTGWDAVIKGKGLDLSQAWSESEQTPQTPKTQKPPLKLAMALDTVWLDPDYPLQNVKGDIFIDNKTILLADVDAKAGSTPITLRFGPTKAGNRILEANSPNAGDMLRALNISDSVQGGTFIMIGGSDAATPQQIRGTLTMTDFNMIKAPLLARLLNAFSFGGLLDLLNQKGLSFSKLETNFVHQEDQIIVKDGRMSGASLGLNFAGTLDQDKNTIDIGGTVVPLQGINKLASKIPVLGTILTGLKGEGLVAATYRFQGPTKSPSVSVNPLSVLTPGILRSIFFEKND